MKYISLNWTKEDDGILFFFQRIEEMLFHYSDDIVRAPIHNARTLLVEYLSNAKDNSKGKVQSYQLEQIIDELCHSLQADKILQHNLGETFISEVSQNIKKDKGASVWYLYRKLNEQTYYNWCTQYLVEHTKQPNHKCEIEFGVRSWIAELLSYGYSPEYIYKHLQETLSGSITTPQRLLDYFVNHFDLKENNYRVYFSFSSELSNYKDLFSNRMGICFESDELFHQTQQRKKDFVGYVQIKAVDRHRAAEIAYTNICTFIRYYRVISNRRRELVRKTAIVIKENDEKSHKIPVKSSGYRSIELESLVGIESLVDSIIIGCQQKNKNTYSQLEKMVYLHNSAIEQHDLNDGFLNLWSILEIVSASIPSQSKIEKVIAGVLPILQKDYFHVVFENINQDLFDNLSEQDYQSLLIELTKNESTIDPICRFIFLPEFEQLREDYFEKLAAFPVIRHKIYSLWKIRDSKSEILSLSNKYAQRVSWHIYRLYRTRNAIVHSGDTNVRIQALGEHLHIYVDRILGELLLKLSNEKTLLTISDVLIDTKLLISQIKTHFSDIGPIQLSDLEILAENYYYSSKGDRHG